MKISVSMIVKNESSCLRKALESVKEADEIVIVDTGSIDNTIDIALEYTSRVYYGPTYNWIDDFSHSRNQSLDLCTGDWILIIDADEHLEEGGIEKLREAISKTDKTGLYFKTVSGPEMHRSIRAFKKESGRWEGKIHNFLIGLDTEEVDITMYYGYSEAHKLDPDRALRILTKVCDENPEVARERYYLAREYYYRKDYENAVKHYDIYLKYSEFTAERADALLMKARCYWFLQRGEDARQACLQAIYHNPDFKEALYFMAEMHYEPWKSKWEKIAKNAENKDVLFINNSF